MREEKEPVLHWRENINLFLTSRSLSGITSMTVQYVIIQYLTKETGSAAILSFATLLGMTPMVLLNPFAGPLVDRWDKKRLSILIDIVVVLFIMVLAVVGTISDTFPLRLVLVSLLICTIAQTFQMPTTQSILPTVVPREELTRINGQLDMAQSANFIIVPTVGAFLFTAIPIDWLILLDVLDTVFGVGLLVLVTIPKVIPQRETIYLLTDMKFGVKELCENKDFWHIILNDAVFMLLFTPAASLYSLMTMGYFGQNAGQAGLVEVVYSVGMLAGGAVTGFFGKWKDQMKPIFMAYVVVGTTIRASGLLPGITQEFFYLFLPGVGTSFATPYFNILLMAIIQQSYKPNVLGQVLGVFNSLMTLPGPTGLIFAGPLADKIGVEKMFLIAGIGTLLCGIVLFLMPVTRNYGKELQEKLVKEHRKQEDEQKKSGDKNSLPT